MAIFYGSPLVLMEGKVKVKRWFALKKAFTILALPGVSTDGKGGSNVGAKAAGEEEKAQADDEQENVWKLKEGQQPPPG